jgi:NADPH:quinone reductase-like Zn-dependent oxidoreductase
MMSITMKAVLYTEFGPPEVLYLADVEKPQPANNEILIRIHATTVAKEDPDMLETPFFNGLNKPKNPIPGMYLAGVVKNVGKDVSHFKIGDKVYGSTGIKGGASAEYISLPEDAALVIKPEHLTFQQAAAVPNGAITTIPFLTRLSQIHPGENVLITGASGTVGTSAVQLAKYLGARVTGVCSTRKIDLVRSLGADEVIDYTQEDFTKNGQSYNVIFDNIGSSSFSRCKSLLEPRGVYLTTVPTLEVLPHFLNPFRNSGKSVRFAATALQKTPKKIRDLNFINQVIEEGKYLPVIDCEYPLEEIIEAYNYVKAGHKTGDVVITID